MKAIQPDYLRSLIFGFEDSLVSTTGLIAGVAVGSQDPRVVLLGGIVAVSVEAISMAAGQFLSERAVHQLEKRKVHDSALIGALLMFGSYSLAGMVPILPVVFFEYPNSLAISIALALVALFALGYIKGRFVKVNAARSGLEVLVVGGSAAIIGAIVGSLVKL